MRISKKCVSEIIECESTDDKHIYIKRYYTLEGIFKKEKNISIHRNRTGNKFMSSTEDAFNYLVNIEDYKIINY